MNLFLSNMFSLYFGKRLQQKTNVSHIDIKEMLRTLMPNLITIGVMIFELLIMPTET